ncbi:uncharacterized protein LOC109703655 [Ananas comosus]|uniref:Uncharacterized protein LOC109703655 n=1 Tax=Ananas comosus TaxID=4615 RepID=A0A6P5EEK6_ANACO|nr:uncharacterized protein LOC109703655 [Ananas comosus]
MSSLAGHVSAFLILFPVGIRRLWLSLSFQARSSPSFRPRPWYFSPEHPLRGADLYALLLLLPIAAFCDYFIFLSLPASSYAGAASFRFSFALHAASLSVFVLLLVVILLSHRFPLLIPDDLLFLLAALAFLSDLPSSPRPAIAAIDAHANELAAVPTLTCAASCFVLSLRCSAAAAAADVALATGMALKGSWALQAGISLYVLPPRGCSRNAVGGGEGWLECVLEDDGRRGLAMLDLLFASHAVAVAVICLGMQYWIAVKSAGRTDLEAMMARLVVSPSELELD